MWQFQSIQGLTLSLIHLDRYATSDLSEALIHPPDPENSLMGRLQHGARVHDQARRLCVHLAQNRLHKAEIDVEIRNPGMVNQLAPPGPVVFVTKIPREIEFELLEVNVPVPSGIEEV